MVSIQILINKIFAPLFMPLEGMRPEYAIAVISAVTGIVLFYLYKWTSDQARLKKVQDGIKAHIIEMTLYKTDIRVMLRALAKVFMRNLIYLRILLLPAAFLFLIFAVILIQCYPRFQYRPVKPGESFTLTAALGKWEDGAAESVKLELPKGIKVETPALPAPSLREVSWRLKADAPGEYRVAVVAGGERQEKTVSVGGTLPPISPLRSEPSLKSYLASPLEPFIEKGGRLSAVSVTYPARAMDSWALFGMDWLVYFFVASFAVALLWKFITGAA